MVAPSLRILLGLSIEPLGFIGRRGAEAKIDNVRSVEPLCPNWLNLWVLPVECNQKP